MVEGHSVHRVATMHRKRLVGKCFKAWSPNGRFTEGAEAINGKLFTKIEAVGKNLFAFFGGNSSGDNNCNGSGSGSGSGGRNPTGRSNIATATDDNDDDNNNDSDVVVVHVHFGMAGAWAVYDTPSSNSNTDDNDEIIVPEPTKTNRLRLEYVTQHHHGGGGDGGGGGLVADLSAMTVNYGGMELYTSKRSKLGEDPLRNDANPESLWNRVSKSKKSIGALIMDQSYFTGPGNIYRAEILFKSCIHPNRSGNTLSRKEFDTVWYHTVDLLRRGYQTGSILTVDRDDALHWGQPKMRRYIYNTSNCPRCSTPIQSWQIASRTCYACPKCQPMKVIPPTTNYSNTENEVAASLVTPERTSSDSSGGASITTSSKNVIPFNSHCARESVSSRLAETGPTRLTVKELKEQLTVRGIPFPKNAKKPTLVTIFVTSTTQTTPVNEDDNDDGNYTKKTSSTTTTTTTIPKTRSKKPYKGKILEFDKKDTSMESSSTVLVSAEHAAMEKASAGENLAVEHIAELAPAQARKARAKATATAGVTTRETVETAAIDTKDEDDRMRRAQRYTVKELKQELKNRNVTFLSKAKKATLIDLLILSSSAAAAAAAAASLAVPSTTKKSSELVIDDEKERSNVVATAAEKPITTKRMEKKREGLCHPDHQQGSKRSKME